ncbi:hypothetical protein M231_01182 [Tremella mesenterica]|uniref:Uncharacterized protein n=1 Tax=Tremella mesenterica TaxID=5217 RepID=A0A4Q1BTR4_TREME|nr:uncharacterized protein TREMEDRAFT_58056 [Tremella mesenterica DSM 1558]EIW71920.1 hypothetical protein TREMEDRAFT_58056 [Tremella mesenterica DSM 1558]RXK41474.1 hypothetical protein M231_01182 [Tremella mesenterica]
MPTPSEITPTAGMSTGIGNSSGLPPIDNATTSTTSDSLLQSLHSFQTYRTRFAMATTAATILALRHVHNIITQPRSEANDGLYLMGTVFTVASAYLALYCSIKTVDCHLCVRHLEATLRNPSQFQNSGSSQQQTRLEATVLEIQAETDRFRGAWFKPNLSGPARKHTAPEVQSQSTSVS